MFNDNHFDSRLWLWLSLKQGKIKRIYSKGLTEFGWKIVEVHCVCSGQVWLNLFQSNMKTGWTKKNEQK